MIWIRFIDDRGNRLGDREMAEAPVVGDDVDLVPDGSVEWTQRRFCVSRRLWIPDYPAVGTEEKKHMIVLLTWS
jgi:hypothetical protein